MISRQTRLFLALLAMACRPTSSGSRTSPAATGAAATTDTAGSVAAAASVAPANSGPPAGYVPAPLPAGPVRIPMAQGVVLVSALHAEDGDRENTVMIGAVDESGVTYTWKYRQHRGLEETEESALTRFVSAADLAGAARLNSIFRQGGGVEETPGYTAMTLSRATFNQVHDRGATPYTIKSVPKGTSDLTDMMAALVTLKGTLTMAQAAPESVSVLVNSERVNLPALHLKGSFDFQDDHRDADYWVLADSLHPLILRVTAGARSFQMIRIQLPGDDHRVEDALERDCRAELPGIYFAFASAEVQPASDPVLQSVATLLGRHPDWSLSIEGHTDSIGDPASNQKLSEARAAAVREELIQRDSVPAARLRSAGFGASHPRESNATLEGRARNRRVEVVRACPGHTP